jgi:hypothetical protein
MVAFRNCESVGTRYGVSIGIGKGPHPWVVGRRAKGIFPGRRCRLVSRLGVLRLNERVRARVRSDGIP